MKIKLQNDHTQETRWVDRDDLQENVAMLRHHTIIDAEMTFSAKDLDWHNPNFQLALHIEHSGRVLAFMEERSSTSADVWHGTTHEIDIPNCAAEDSDVLEWMEANRQHLAAIVACLGSEWDGSNWSWKRYDSLNQIWGLTNEDTLIYDFPRLQLYDYDEWIANEPGEVDEELIRSEARADGYFLI